MDRLHTRKNEKYKMKSATAVLRCCEIKECLYDCWKEIGYMSDHTQKTFRKYILMNPFRFCSDF